MRNELLAVVDDFEFMLTDDDSKFLVDFDKFFRQLVMEDGELKFLDKQFADDFFEILAETFSEGSINDIIVEFVKFKFEDYFNGVGGDSYGVS
jgi:hypothetical protein